MKTLTIIIFLAISGLLYAGSQHYAHLQASGQGAYTVTIAVNGEQTAVKVHGYFSKVVKVRPGDRIEFGATANRNPVEIQIDDLGATVMSYSYCKISKTIEP